MPLQSQIPFIVGVTGHREIDEAPLRAPVQQALQALQQKFPASLHVLSALADGADQLVAEVAGALGIPVVAVLPMAHDDYRGSLGNKSRFDTLWHKAALKIALPASVDADRAYEQLGILLCRRSHILLALWNGDPAALNQDGKPAKPGGTAAVVKLRLEGEWRNLRFPGEHLFETQASPLDLSPSGPLLHIQSEAGDGKPPVGTCRIYPGFNDYSDAPRGQPAPFKPAALWDNLPQQSLHDFNNIVRLNHDIATFGKLDQVIADKQSGYLPFPTHEPPPSAEAKEHLKQLRHWQAMADAAAQKFQRRLFGILLPFDGKVWSRLKLWISNFALPRLGGILLFTLAVPFGVLFFELFHVYKLEQALYVYLAIFVYTVCYYHFRVKHHSWQHRFQDYRAMAEALRVQLFWAAGGLNAAASDNYLRKQGGDLGWIQFALRGPALWSMAAAHRLDGPWRAYVGKGWIDDQLGFFRSKGRVHKASAEIAKYAAQASIGLGLLASFGLFGVTVFHAWLPDSEDVWKHVEDGLVMAAALAPALVAFFTVSASLRASEAHAHSYGLMARLFGGAKAEVARSETDDAYQNIVLALGREALAENADWLLDHRHRPIENQ